MKFKCFLIGHRDKYEIFNQVKNQYKATCFNCGDVKIGHSKEIVNFILSGEYYNRYKFAWDALKGLFPHSFKEELGKTKHVLSFYSDGRIVFKLDLRPEEINFFRSYLIETDPGYFKWELIPILSVAK